MGTNDIFQGMMMGTMVILSVIFIAVKMDIIYVGVSYNSSLPISDREQILQRHLEKAKVDQYLARYLAQLDLSSSESKDVVKLINSIRLEDDSAIEASLDKLSEYQDELPQPNKLKIEYLYYHFGV